MTSLIYDVVHSISSSKTFSDMCVSVHNMFMRTVLSETYMHLSCYYYVTCTYLAIIMLHVLILLLLCYMYLSCYYYVTCVAELIRRS